MLTRRGFLPILLAIWPLSHCSRLTRYPTYPSNIVDGVITTNQADIHLWQVEMRKQYSTLVPVTSYSVCRSCNMPWWVVDGHIIWYGNGRGSFVVCEMCWKNMGSEGCRKYYRTHFEEQYPEMLEKFSYIYDNQHEINESVGIW